MKTYDAIVIGAGPGGYPCAIRLGQLGLRTLCIEKDKPGGVCLNWGCIPSKALIYASTQYEKARHKNADIGVRCSGVELDVGAMQSWKNGVVSRLNNGVRGLLKGAGVDWLAGSARVAARDIVEVTASDGSVERIRAEKGIVVATGSQTIELPTFKFDGQRVIGAKEAVSLPAVPRRLCVIGGGVIGLELGTVYQKLGSELIVVEALPELLTGIDPDCTKIVERKLVKHGARIHKRALAKGWEAAADGSLRVTIEIAGKAEVVECDVVLVAVGMRPQSRGLGLEELGVTIDAKGFVPIDARGRTNVPGIYAIGDVSGPPLLAHKATKQGEVVAEVIAGKAAAMDWVTIPGAVFTDPEVAVAGLTEAEAKEKGHEVRIGKFPFAALGKAMAITETDGFVKIVADKQTHQILGVHIVGPEASTVICEAALALEMAGFLEDLSLTVHPHPTLGESMMEAAAHALGHAIHIPNR